MTGDELAWTDVPELLRRGPALMETGGHLVQKDVRPGDRSGRGFGEARG